MRPRPSLLRNRQAYAAPSSKRTILVIVPFPLHLVLLLEAQRLRRSQLQQLLRLHPAVIRLPVSPRDAPAYSLDCAVDKGNGAAYRYMLSSTISPTPPTRCWLHLYGTRMTLSPQMTVFSLSFILSNWSWLLLLLLWTLDWISG